MSIIESREVIVCGVRYWWVGGYGAVIKSFERGMKIGDVRVIGEDMLYVYLIYPRFWRTPEVCWTFIDPTNECINKFRQKLFG